MAKTKGKGKMGRGAKVLLILLAAVVLLAVLQSIPIWLLRNPGMETLTAPGLVIHYDGEDSAGAELAAERLPDKLAEIREKLGQDDAPVELYLYRKQSSLHLRKYGLVTLLLAPSWYVGDNKGDVALVLSPKSAVEGYSQNDLLRCATHELVHCYNDRSNPALSYFLDNGAACYLAEQVPDPAFRKDVPGFPYALTQSEDERAFGENGGYSYAYWYVEYLETIYGWEAISALLRGESYESVFSMDERAVYDDWMTYMDLYYPTESMS